jgi:hypothetical protein
METVGPAVERLIKRHLASAREVLWATVTSYDSQTHRARTQLWPEGTHSGPLPVLASSPGHCPPLAPGQQVLVLCTDGVPAAVAGCAFPDTQPLPDAPFVNEGDAHILGDLVVYGQLGMRDEDRDGALDWMAPGPSLPARANAAGGAAGGFATLDASSHVVQQAVYDATEASTMDALGAASIITNNMNRLRNQLGVVIGGVGSAWNAAVQMIPLSQKAAASGVASLDASSHVLQALAVGVRQVVTYQPGSDIWISAAFQSNTPSITYSDWGHLADIAITTVAGSSIAALCIGTPYNWQGSTNSWFIAGLALDGASVRNCGINRMPTTGPGNFPQNSCVLAFWSGVSAGSHNVNVIAQAGGPTNSKNCGYLATPMSASGSLSQLMILVIEYS